jgi:uncharacterized membrane protein HdeD (DUF308 family)
MIQKYLFGAWFILTGLVVLFVWFKRSRRAKGELQLNEVFDLSLAVFGGISAIYLVLQTWLHFDELQRLIGLEGLVAMTLGIFATIWFCARTIRSLATRP